MIKAVLAVQRWELIDISNEKKPISWLQLLQKFYLNSRFLLPVPRLIRNLDPSLKGRAHAPWYHPASNTQNTFRASLLQSSWSVRPFCLPSKGLMSVVITDGCKPALPSSPRAHEQDSFLLASLLVHL